MRSVSWFSPPAGGGRDPLLCELCWAATDKVVSLGLRWLPGSFRLVVGRFKWGLKEEKTYGNVEMCADSEGCVGVEDEHS